MAVSSSSFPVCSAAFSFGCLVVAACTCKTGLQRAVTMQHSMGQAAS